MADENTVIRMLQLVHWYELDGAEFVSSFTVEELAKDFNGIGPEWFPAELRAAIDRMSADLQPVAFVHDVRYAHGDGTKEDFKAANAEFRKNGHKVAKAKYGWWRPMRYLLMREATAFARLCQLFGWSAYVEAGRRGPAVRESAGRRGPAVRESAGRNSPAPQDGQMCQAE